MWRTWELEVLAKHIDDDMPALFVIDVDGEGGDRIVRQRHKRWLSRLLWLWFLSSRARAWHIGKCGKVRGGRWLSFTKMG